MSNTMTFKVVWSKPKKFAAGNFNVKFDGVYVIGFRNTETDKRTIVYVGQGDIGTRLADHYRSNVRVKRKLGETGRIGYYRWAKCTDEETRLDIELGLYRKHGGAKLCNEIEPPGSGRKVNIEVNEEFG